MNLLNLSRSAIVARALPILARILLAIVLLGIGVSSFADGYGPILVTIGTGVLVAELVGFGLSQAQAQSIAQYVADLERRLEGTTPTSPPTE